MKKNHIQDAEDLLRNGRLPDQDAAKLRHKAWQRVLKKQRSRRRGTRLFNLHPWIWTLASIAVVVIAIIFLLVVRGL